MDSRVYRRYKRYFPDNPLVLICHYLSFCRLFPGNSFAQANQTPSVYSKATATWNINRVHLVCLLLALAWCSFPNLSSSNEHSRANLLFLNEHAQRCSKLSFDATADHWST